MPLRISGIVPEGATEATVNVVLRSTAANGAGTVYVDDVDFHYGEEDYEAPSVPVNLQQVKVAAKSLDVKWSASSDNVAVMGYRIYLNGSLFGTTRSLSYRIGNLIPKTNHNVAVSSYDANGNESELAKITASTFGANMILNGSFEANSNMSGESDNWSSSISTGATGSIDWIVNPKMNGQYAQKISAAGLTSSTRVKVYQRVNVDPGKSYLFRSHVRVMSIQNAEFEMYADFADANGIVIGGEKVELNTVNNNFVPLVVQGVIPEKAAYVTLNFVIRGTSSNGSGTVVIDNAEFNYLNVAKYEYDANNRLTRITYADGSEERFVYDANGALISRRKIE